MEIVVGLSGGVDSSVAAHLMREAGEDIAGMFMKNWEEDDRFGTCTAEEDAQDAAKVCERLQIPLYTRNFAAEYWDNVFEHFLAEYRALRTPNPDILCNREIKFKTFLEHAQDLGAEVIATGHYARIGRADGQLQLLKGLDHGKDQSYFLYTLGQEQLERTRFPVGELDKAEVRDIAQRVGLHVHGKKDSTGICFIGERDFKKFLSEYIPAQPGAIEDLEGQTLGQHDGLMFYTLGQRQGLGIGGIKTGSGQPWYVVGKRVEDNVLLVAQGHNHPALFARGLEANELTWVAGQSPALPVRCAAKTRYRQADQPCLVEATGPDQVHVTFDDPQRAVTPGQSVVFYDGDVCLGGGVINQATLAERIAA